MAGTSQFTIGSEVSGSDGLAGRVSRPSSSRPPAAMKAMVTSRTRWVTGPTTVWPAVDHPDLPCPDLTGCTTTED